MARKTAKPEIVRLRIDDVLTARQVESALGAAGAASKSGASIELARVDYLPKKTVVFYRSSRAVDSNVRKALQRITPKAKMRVKKVSSAMLKRAP